MQHLYVCVWMYISMHVHTTSAATGTPTAMQYLYVCMHCMRANTSMHCHSYVHRMSADMTTPFSDAATVCMCASVFEDYVLVMFLAFIY
jgi:hypothetical protein